MFYSGVITEKKNVNNRIAISVEEKSYSFFTFIL